MYLPQNDVSEVVLRQRNQKDELSKEIQKNKTKLTQLEQEIRFLTQPLSTDYDEECDRLDDEIDKLRRVCQAMLNEIENIKRVNETQAEQRQPIRPAPPPPPHPSPQAPPRARPQNLFPPLSQQQHSPQSPHSPQVALVSQNRSPSSLNPIQNQLEPTNCQRSEEREPNNGEQPWVCSMCTFQNHPLLNKCECCDNVRILPGTVRIVPSRPPPPPPSLAPLPTRSAPQTPGTPVAGPAAVRLLSLPTGFNSSAVSPTSSNASTGNLPSIGSDVII